MLPPSALPRFNDPSVTVAEWITRIFIERPAGVRYSKEYSEIEIDESVLPEYFSVWNASETLNRNTRAAMKWLRSYVIEKETGPWAGYMGKPVASCAYRDGQFQIEFHPDIMALAGGKSTGDS